MTRSLFREGGPYEVRRAGSDQFSLRIPIPEDSDGRIARECPQAQCSPGYFKVKLGTGVEHQKVAYCPYCRHAAEPSEFATKEQIRYATDVTVREAQQGVERMLEDALSLGPTGRKEIGGGLISIEMSYKPGTPPHVWPPVEDELLRAVVCPYCGLDHAVFGLATWCSDCGSDIFMTHVRAECEVVRKMLSSVQQREKDLGARIAARDIENSLEDAVSIFEAVLKALFARALRKRGVTEEEVQSVLAKRVRNAFQNVDHSAKLIEEELGLPLFAEPTGDAQQRLKRAFEKRHPITHNLGVVDRKYLDNALSAEGEGREIRVTSDEILEALDVLLGVLGGLHSRLFAQDGRSGETGPPGGGNSDKA